MWLPMWLGTIYEWSPRTGSALAFGGIQNAREQYSRLDTLIRSYAAQDMKTGPRTTNFSITS